MAMLAARMSTSTPHEHRHGRIRPDDQQERQRDDARTGSSGQDDLARRVRRLHGG